MRRYYISCPCEDKNLSKPDQIVDLPSPRTKSKQKQTPSKIIWYLLFIPISGNIVEFSPLCILVGISCLQKRLTKSNKGQGHDQPQTCAKFSKPYFLPQCHYVLDNTICPMFHRSQYLHILACNSCLHGGWYVHTWKRGTMRKWQMWSFVLLSNICNSFVGRRRNLSRYYNEGNCARKQLRYSSSRRHSLWPNQNF